MLVQSGCKENEIGGINHGKSLLLFKMHYMQESAEMA
jgi:hypothetical protein